MDTLKAELLCKQKLREHGLTEWKFRWATAKNRLGQCRYGEKTITLSIDFVSLNDEKMVLDTIMHEIAHALVGPGHGHDWVWKSMALKLGATPRHATSVPNKAPSKWNLVCPNCGKKSPRHRKTNTVKACGSCCAKYNGGKFTTQYKMNWVVNSEKPLQSVYDDDRLGP